MKILYSAGNRFGAGEELRRFLLDPPNVTIKTAAYSGPSRNIAYIDWTLDALHNKEDSRNPQDLVHLFGHTGIPRISVPGAELLIEEISEYQPDLIICDGEPIISHIAQTLGVSLWYVSPLHVLQGVEWSFNTCHYTALLETTRKMLKRLPPAQATFILSPFGSLGKLKLKKGFNWLNPCGVSSAQSVEVENIFISSNGHRHSNLSKICSYLNSPVTTYTPLSRDYPGVKPSWYFTTGETSFIFDGIQFGAGRLAIAPDLTDPETLVNAFLCQEFGLGDDLAQVELMERYALHELERSQNRPRIPQTNLTSFSTLKEWVNQYASGKQRLK